MKNEKEVNENEQVVDINQRAKENFVSFQNINKIYPNGAQAVFDFNLDVKKNEFIVLVGPSGCGKSTTLRMLAGLENITSGQLFIDEHFSNFTLSKERKISMVFQSYALYPQMTVYDNIAYPLKINKYPFEEDIDGVKKTIYRKLTKEEIDEKVFNAAKILDLGPYLDRQPRQLSGGQMQRVALGRAIVKNVPLFLMDEPLSNLDAKLRLSMRSEIVKLHNQIGATTIYVTHDQTEAMTMASRVVVMSKGFIQQIDAPKMIYNHPANIFVAKFIGSPAMNIFETDYEKGFIHLGEEVKIPLGDKFVKRHDEFYKEKVNEFENITKDFNLQSEQYIKKIQSALTTDAAPIEKTKKTAFFSKLLKAFKKDEKNKMENKQEVLAKEKLNLLKAAANGKHQVFIGIRPENMKAIKYQKDMDKTNKLLTKVTVCELLGAEYNIHFTLFNQDTIVKMPASEDVKVGDTYAIEFDTKKIAIFDPITGDVI